MFKKKKNLLSSHSWSTYSVSANKNLQITAVCVGGAIKSEHVIK